jgi:hypothetical protein
MFKQIRNPGAGQRAGARWPLLMVGAISCLAAGYGLGHRHRSSAPVAIASTEVNPQSHPPAGRRVTAPVPRLTVAPSASAPGDCEAASQPAARRERASYFFGQLFRRLEVVPDSKIVNAEVRASTVVPYLNGMVDAVRKSDPGLRESLAGEMTSTLCGGSLPEARAILLARLASHMPEIATPQGFECFFAQARDQETVPLWAMIDAWRSSGQEKPAALLALEKVAKDPRTLNRLSGVSPFANMLGKDQRR